MSNSGRIVEVCLRILSLCSLLHLMLITCDRLIAIKFTLRYPRLITTPSIKAAVITVWIVSFISEVSRTINNESITVISDLSVASIYISCILFIVCSYVILYREILRHHKKIKIEQIPQEELERFAKEHKALQTTVFVVGALLLCFVPGTFVLIFIISGPLPPIPVFNPLFRTFLMLNSFLNPLIYCWRQEEMRKFPFRCKRQAHVPPANWKQTKHCTWYYLLRSCAQSFYSCSYSFVDAHLMSFTCKRLTAIKFNINIPLCILKTQYNDYLNSTCLKS